MGKTQIDEDKGTPGGDLTAWVNKWSARGVNRAELIGTLAMMSNMLEALALRAMTGAKGKKDKETANDNDS